MVQFPGRQDNLKNENTIFQKIIGLLVSKTYAEVQKFSTSKQIIQSING